MLPVPEPGMNCTSHMWSKVFKSPFVIVSLITGSPEKGMLFFAALNDSGDTDE